MNDQEARRALHEILNRYRLRTYAELAMLVGNQETFEVPGESGANYQIEIQAVWEDKTRKIIRVLGAIDDGGVRAFMPVSDDFLITPDGEFVGE
jgi:hypothetical protein